MLLGLVAAALLAVGTWASWLAWTAERHLERRSLERPEATTEAAPRSRTDDPLTVLLVGSDDRSDLTAEERRELRTGDFEDENTDTIMLVQVRPDDDGLSVLSLPRDLAVDGPGTGRTRINAVRAQGGPSALVATVEELLGIDVDHYLEVSIPGFVAAVDAVGHVELCLDRPLRDRRAGADLDAGCHRADGAAALAYVRSRAGDRGDFDRTVRQQRFLTALADRITSLGVLADPIALRRLVTAVADGLTVDEDLTLTRMVRLADTLRTELRGAELDAFTLPASPAGDGDARLRPYGPGVAHLGRLLRDGDRLPPTARGDEDDDREVGLWPGDDPGHSGEVESVLFHAGLDPRLLPSPGDISGDTTTVYAREPDGELARWVAGLLGAPTAPLPVDPPSGDAPGVFVHAAGP